LDVILAHKLRAPGQPELALGAISESGQVYLDPQVMDFFGDVKPYLEKETRLQLAQIRTLKKQLRGDRPPARIRGRSVIVTDDGIATGSTMIAALQILKSQHPCEIVVAVPVSSPERLEQVGQSCDQAICLLAPRSFRSVGQFYADFSQVEDEQVINLLHEFNSAVPSRDRPVPTEPT
jgi:predicted phosphoribosyltransferase